MIKILDLIKNEEKAKQILEVMLMNDAPMQLLGFTWLEQIRRGYKSRIEDFDSLNVVGSKKLELCELLNGIKQEQELVRDVYSKIDVSKLDEETGKSIVEECQPLVKEFYEQYSPLLDNYIKNGFKPQEVPERLFDIRNIVIKAGNEYGKLPANNLYYCAMHVGYFDYKNKKESRIEWFINGKQTTVHPEKLPLVLLEYLVEYTPLYDEECLASAYEGFFTLMKKCNTNEQDERFREAAYKMAIRILETGAEIGGFPIKCIKVHELTDYATSLISHFKTQPIPKEYKDKLNGVAEKLFQHEIVCPTKGSKDFLKKFIEEL